MAIDAVGMDAGQEQQTTLLSREDIHEQIAGAEREIKKKLEALEVKKNETAALRAEVKNLRARISELLDMLDSPDQLRMAFDGSEDGELPEEDGEEIIDPDDILEDDDEDDDQEDDSADEPEESDEDSDEEAGPITDESRLLAATEADDPKEQGEGPERVKLQALAEELGIDPIDLRRHISQVHGLDLRINSWVPGDTAEAVRRDYTPPVPDDESDIPF